MTADVLSGILRRFVIYLEVLPYNLRLFAHTALFFLATINIALTIYNNIDNNNFNYLKWGRVYILKIGFVLFAINRYEWLLNGVKDFFFYAVEKAIRIKYTTNDYIMDPSKLYSQGQDVAEYVWKHFVSVWPQDWGYWVFYWLILGGFLILTIQVIICWVEYYFLTGFSFIFLPFGALDMGLEYYKNVFKTIVSATIKLAVMQFWILISSVILKDLFKVIHEKSFGKEKLLLLLGTLYVLVAVMQVLPSLTSGILTGSPAVNASAAMASAVSATTAATVGLASKVYHTAQGTYETGKGAIKGAKTGSNVGGTWGSKGGAIIGGPVGAALLGGTGKILGGAIGATVGGSYAGAKYTFTKQGSKKEDKKEKDSSKEKKSSTTEKANTETSTVSGTTTNSDTGKNNNGSSSNTTEKANTVASEPSTQNVNTATNQNTDTGTNSNTASVDSSTQNVNTTTNQNTDTGTNSNTASVDSSTQNVNTTTNQNTDTGTNSNTASRDSSTQNINTTTNQNTDTSNTNIDKERVRENLPDWAKDDY